MSRFHTPEPLQEAACGTPAGANRHRDLGEPVCDTCTHGLARYRRRLRAATAGGGESVRIDCDDLDFPSQYEMPRVCKTPVGEWARRAACIGKPPHWWFPDTETITPEAAEALTICAACPVRDECLDHALDNNEPHGIWGGASETERRRLRRNRGAA